MNMKAKIFTLFFAILLLLTACNTSQTEQVKIGVSLPLTGPAALPGRFIQQGVELAYEQLSEEDKAKIKIVYEDDQCNPNTGLTVAKKLVELEGVRFIVGPLCGAVINPTMQYYDENKIIRLRTGAYIDHPIERKGYDFAFFGRVKDLMKKLAEHVYEKGTRNVAILSLQDDYGEENKNYFEKYFTAKGGKVVVKETFPQGSTDFRTQLTKIKSKEPEAVFIAAYGPALVNILKQMNELKISVPKYSIYNTEDPEVVKNSGELIEGTVYPFHLAEPKTDKEKQYAQKYKEKHRTNREMISANAFDNFNALVGALKKCNQETECVRTELKNIKNYNGASGIFSVDEEGVGARTPYVKIVKNGKFEVLR